MLGVYVNSNTALTAEERRIRIWTSVAVSVLMLLGLAWSVYDSMQFSKTMNEDFERQVKKLESDFAEMDRDAQAGRGQSASRNVDQSSQELR